MKLNVAVMFGGESVEHEVSIITAIQAMEALNREKYQVIPVYISKNREFYSHEDLLNIETYQDLDELVQKYPPVHLYRENERVFIAPLKKKFFTKKAKEVDVVLPIMHGTNGEDGVLQGYLEMLKVPYSGSDVTASAIGQDKVIMRHVLENSNLPLVPWFWFYGEDFINDQALYIGQANELGFPLIIKPANLGSSIGISIAHDEVSFISGVQEAMQFDEKIVVEHCIKELREVNCSVMGNHADILVSELEEVGKEDEILSFEDKYINGNKKGDTKSSGMASASRIIPANISKEHKEKIKKLAHDTFKVLNSSGITRIDFMIDEQDNSVYVNEINSIPGSLAFYLWKPKDIDFTELMDRLVDQAIDRQRRKERMTFSYSSNILSNFNKNAVKNGKLK